ncbi:unnamed protein product, partial [Rotaria magnacalcarata]
KLPNFHPCETVTSIDVISIFQSSNIRQQSLAVASIPPNTSIKTSKPQISRQLLESLVTAIDSKMPLAQNYKDDVSLLESETALSKAKTTCNTMDFNIRQETDLKIDVS